MEALWIFEEDGKELVVASTTRTPAENERLGQAALAEARRRFQATGVRPKVTIREREEQQTKGEAA